MDHHRVSSVLKFWGVVSSSSWARKVFVLLFDYAYINYSLIIRKIHGVSPYCTQYIWCVSLLYAKYMVCLLIIRKIHGVSPYYTQNTWCVSLLYAKYMVCLLIIRKIHCVFPTTVSSQAFQPMVNFIVNFEHIS